MDINQNLSNLMKEAQKLQKRMEEAQDELTKLVVEGQSGGGMVKVRMNGRHELLSMEIAPALRDEDIDMMGDLFVAAVNDAVRKVEKASKEKISQFTTDINIPPDFLKKDE